MKPILIVSQCHVFYILQKSVGSSNWTCWVKEDMELGKVWKVEDVGEFRKKNMNEYDKIHCVKSQRINTNILNRKELRSFPTCPHAFNPITWRWRQEGCLESEACLGYIASTKLVKAIKQDLISKTKTNTNK